MRAKAEAEIEAARVAAEAEAASARATAEAARSEAEAEAATDRCVESLQCIYAVEPKVQLLLHSSPSVSQRST